MENSLVGSLADGGASKRRLFDAGAAQLGAFTTRFYDEYSQNRPPTAALDGDPASHVTNRQRMMLWVGHQSHRIVRQTSNCIQATGSQTNR